MTSEALVDDPFKSMLPRVVSRLRFRSGADLAYGGLVNPHSRRLTITCLDGTRTDTLKGLTLPAGIGVGGRVATRGLPVVVDIRVNAQDAPDRRDWLVSGEGVRAVFAVPVQIDGAVRAVLYGAMRSRAVIDSTAVDAAMVTARRFEHYLVERGSGRTSPASHGGLRGSSGPSLEALYQIDTELTELTAQSSDPAIRERIKAIRYLLEEGCDDGMPERPSTFSLSPRELEVIELVALGCSNAETAQRLAVRPETVKAYLRSIMQKLGVNNRTAAVNVARKAGLLPR